MENADKEKFIKQLNELHRRFDLWHIRYENNRNKLKKIMEEMDEVSKHISKINKREYELNYHHPPQT
jgi:hypothetical protein